MGVYANSNVDFSAIAFEMGGTIANWFNASVQIVDPNSSESTWDVYTNTEVTAEPTILWEGRARIQPLSNYATPVVGYVELSDRQVRVNLPLDIDAGFIRKGLQIHVIDPGNDYMFSNQVMNITGAINSSYAWARTVMCIVDVKNPVE